MTHLNPALDRDQIMEALKAASLDDICAELLRKAKLCDAMEADCDRFAEHEDDAERRESHYSAATAFYKKAQLYRDMVHVAKGWVTL